MRAAWRTSERLWSLPSLARSFSSSASEGQRIAVGISGGVDSAVAALLLKRAGYEVEGVFMRNWDEAEELDNKNCSVEKDLRDAASVCRQLNIPLHEADFVSTYWNSVFTTFLADCARGLTPNPDLACNRHIKFGALLEFAGNMGIETVATGHYARVQLGPNGTAPRLLRGVDRRKDQSYFLASVHAEALRHVVFPLGTMHKVDVRQIAVAEGLAPATKRSSAGICFIGRRNFAGFLAQYLPAVSGRYIDVDSGRELGLCHNLLSITLGQRPGIGGSSDRTYVAGKDVVENVVYVATGREHPALKTRTACLREPHWLSAAHAEALARDGILECEYKARYGQEPAPCTLQLLRTPKEAESLFQRSAFCGLHPQDAEARPGFVLVHFSMEPATAITPQQVFVMYDGDLCLGSADIFMPGATVHEEAAAERGQQFSREAAAKI